MLFENPTIPAPFNRVAVLEAFLERPVWTQRAVETASSILGKDYWWMQRYEVHPVIERLTKELKLWERLEHLIPESGSLRLALVRPSRKERVRRAMGRIRRHADWRTASLKREIGYKEYKTRSAIIKQRDRLEEAIARDMVLQRCKRLYKVLESL